MRDVDICQPSGYIGVAVRHALSSLDGRTAMKKRKEKYEFTLILEGPEEVTAELEDGLFDAGLDDALIGQRDGAIFLDFTREGRSLASVIVSAIRQVERAGLNLKVAGFEPSPIVTLSDMGRRAGISREMARLVSLGKRKRARFPPPVMGIKSRSPVWWWVEVAPILQTRPAFSARELEVAYQLRDLSLALELRVNRKRLQKVSNLLKQIGGGIKISAKARKK